MTARLCSALLDWYFTRIAFASHLDFIPQCFFSLLWIPVTWTMDSDNSSSALLAGKVHTCHCGKRMSSLTNDFHTVCIDWRDVDCDLDHCCVECHDTDDSTMTEYVRHKLTLRRKMLSKCKLKELKLSDISDVIYPAPDEAVCSDAPLSVEPPLTVDSPSVSYSDVNSRMYEKLSTMKANIFSQFSSMFTDFSRQLECKFSKIDDRFDKLGSY